MPEHTPGPWTIKELPPDDCGELEPGFLIEGKSTLHLIVAPCTDGWVSGQNEANAKLIAAAPDLLNACLEMKRVALEEMGFRSYSRCEQAAIDKVLAAITKATS